MPVHHILFARNRVGISAHQEGISAVAATWTVFHPSSRTPDLTCGLAAPGPTTLGAVATEVTDTDNTDPEQLRVALAAQIRRCGIFKAPQVDAAFLAVPRHLVLSGVELETAYAPKVVVTKRAQDGTALSSASSPNLVASMLEQFDVQTGHLVAMVPTATRTANLTTRSSSPRTRGTCPRHGGGNSPPEAAWRCR